MSCLVYSVKVLNQCYNILIRLLSYYQSPVIVPLPVLIGRTQCTNVTCNSLEPDRRFVMERFL